MKENQPKHRQLRKEQRKLARRRANREGYPAILIICEGRETEPNYIRGFCESRRINLANVTLCAGSYETDAVSLVEIARQRFETDPDYDGIYVICDDDGGPLQKARALASESLPHRDGRRISVELICSRPCIEFWLLLHFEYSSRAYRSAAEVIADLRRHVTNYEKSDPHIFKQVEVGVDRAVANAKKLRRELAASGALSPGCDMDQLIERLLSMRRPDRSTKQ
jgi:hypothetical protein